MIEASVCINLLWWLHLKIWPNIEIDPTRDLELSNELINDLDLHINYENELFHELIETDDIENESENIDTASTVSTVTVK